PGGAQHAGRAFASLVGALRRGHVALRVRVEHGRRKPGVRGHADRVPGPAPMSAAPRRRRAARAIAATVAAAAAAVLAALVPVRGDAPGDVWERLPAIVAGIQAPHFPDRNFVITSFGARADGATDASPALRAAIAACHRAGGGRVVVPAGDF